jgi:hypothetical protein
VVLYEVKDPTPAAGGQFGWSLTKTDYNKDATPDLYVGQSPHHVGGTGIDQSGGTYVFDGRDGSLLKSLELPASDAQPGAPGNNGSNLGWGMAAPGDLNGDGEPDYVAGAPFTDVGPSAFNCQAPASGCVQDVGREFFFLSNLPRAGNYYTLPYGTPPGTGGKARTRLSAAIRGIRRGGVVSSLARGRVIRAAGSTARCSGRVRIRVRGSRRGRIVASRLATVARSCRWSKRFVFPTRRLTRRQRRALARGRKIRLYASFRYGGNSGLEASTASRSYVVKSRRGKR